MIFAQIYEGCACPAGTHNVSPHQIVDTERDKVFDELVCKICGRSVTKEKMHKGKLLMHILSDEEIQAEIGFYADDDDLWNEYDDDN